jgi:hypothetical protein
MIVHCSPIFMTRSFSIIISHVVRLDFKHIDCRLAL